MQTTRNKIFDAGDLPSPDLSGMMKISDREFDLIRTLVYDQFGINLTEQKRSLVVGRLQKYLRSSGFATFKEYYDFLTNDTSLKSLTDLINRISTNYSFFYR